MKKTKVIKNTRIRLPFQSTILYSFLLYYFDVNDIVWVIFGTLYTIFWIIAIIIKVQEEEIDLFGKDQTKDLKPTFKERIDKVMNT